MLGPVDIEDWSDDYANLCARVRRRREFVALKCDPNGAGLEKLDKTVFGLLARFRAEDRLSINEIRLLTRSLHT
jgi:hypothetical protein